MRANNRQNESRDCDKIPEADAEQSPQTELIGPSLNSDGPSEVETVQSENHSLLNVAGTVDKLHSNGLIGDADQSVEAFPVEQPSLEETLEEELASDLHENSSLSYIKSKANKLETAIRQVNLECDNLIAVCDPPEIDPIAQANAEMLLGSNGSSSGLTSKRMLAIASVALLATCGGVYAYVNPQNPIQLALHSKIAGLAGDPITVAFLEPSEGSYASLVGIMPSSRNFTPSVKTAAISPLEPARLTSVSMDKLNTELPSDGLETKSENSVVSGSSQLEARIADAPIVREVIPQPRRSSVSLPSPAEPVGLSERFGRGEPSVENQSAVDALQEPKAVRTSNLTPDSPSRLMVPITQKLNPQSELIAPPKKRNIEMVKRVVLQANAGATLDNSQFEILVTRLVEGDCPSSALHDIFGESKISPVFVRELLTEMENRC